MLVKAKLKPGENGTRALLIEYGDQLVCVRYRHDRKRHKRYKTIELIIEEKDWIPDTLIPATWRVYVRVGYGETELRELIKQAGGYWNPDKKGWQLTYRSVIELGPEKRIIDQDIGFQLAYMPTKLFNGRGLRRQRYE